MKIKCHTCKSIFDEKYLIVNNVTGEAFCPLCRIPDNLEEIEETENYNKFRNILTYNISVTDLVNFDNDEEDDTLNIIVHNIVKELKTDRKCPRCNAQLYCSDLHEYEYVCVECDENFYEMEVK